MFNRGVRKEFPVVQKFVESLTGFKRSLTAFNVNLMTFRERAKKR
jgi:hypothetical protein